MGLINEMIPHDCYVFVKNEFARLGIPLPQSVEQILEVGASSAIEVIDIFEPYSLFYNVTDVVITDDWCKYTYEITDDDGRVFEAEPEVLETFSLVPGTSQNFVNFARSHPGLKAFPSGFGYTIEMNIRGDISGESALDRLDPALRVELAHLCTEPDNTVSYEKMIGYLSIAAWATTIWFASNDADHIRCSLHHIFSESYEYGECILYNGIVISPARYKKRSRSPGTCLKCGVNAWCAEPTLVGGDMHYLCESCLYGNDMTLPGTDCGTKICKYVGCPNHPEFSSGDHAQYLYYKQHGQLVAEAAGAGHLLDSRKRGMLR